jgi:hypothetical protein
VVCYRFDGYYRARGCCMSHISSFGRSFESRSVQCGNSEAKYILPSASLCFIQAVHPRGKIAPDLTVWRSLYNGSSVIDDSVWKPLVQPPLFQPRDVIWSGHVKLLALLSLPITCRQSSCAELGILGEGFRMVTRGGVIKGYPRPGHVFGHGAALDSHSFVQQFGI